jgi:hypothetical protein
MQHPDRGVFCGNYSARLAAGAAAAVMDLHVHVPEDGINKVAHDDQHGRPPGLKQTAQWHRPPLALWRQQCSPAFEVLCPEERSAQSAPLLAAGAAGRGPCPPAACPSTAAATCSRVQRWHAYGGSNHQGWQAPVMHTPTRHGQQASQAAVQQRPGAHSVSAAAVPHQQCCIHTMCCSPAVLMTVPCSMHWMEAQMHHVCM